MTPRRSTGETPYSLTYGAEAVIPVEISLCSSRISNFSSVKNEELMLKQLDLLKARWEVATIRLANYQQLLARRYNRDLKTKEFGAGDLVLRKAVESAQGINARKLALNWEGPYRVTVIAGSSAYYLEGMEERPLPRPWNVQNLRKFYH